MRFWDSSAIIPLCLREGSSEKMKVLAKEDQDIVVWWSTRIECVSALSRRVREGVLSADAETKARAILSALAMAWSEVQPTETLRRRAERLLAVHPLRAADAFQLAAALIWVQESPTGRNLVCLDQNLIKAASREGFAILP